MTYDVLGAKALNYAPCRYGTSRILFRGPARRLDVPYVAFIGGTETYGKFIKAPFPALVESDLGVNCVNFGVANAGIDVFLNESFILESANNARVTVLQIVGAQNLSNRFYSVHPRRNDRFLTASPVLMSIFPEVDFSEFHFTRHMLNILFQVSPQRFATVIDEIQQSWLSRMRLLLRRIQGDVVLLWFSECAPTDAVEDNRQPSDCIDPLFVTRKMVDDLRAHVSEYIEVVASDDALKAGTQGMVFSEMELMAARQILGPKAHGEAAFKLRDTLHRLV